MNCPEVGLKLGARADGELPGSIRAAVDEHLETCPVCREEAERLDSNVAFLRRNLSRLASSDGLSAAFLQDLKPRTRAEIAALERDAAGPKASGGGSRVLIAVGLIALAAVGWFVVQAMSDDEPGEERADVEESPDATGTDPDRGERRGGTGGTGRNTTGSGGNVPRDTAGNEARTVRGPQPVLPKSSARDAPELFAKALAARNPSLEVTRTLQIVVRGLRDETEIAALREVLGSASLAPRVRALLLAALGGGADRDGSLPLFVENLRAPEAVVRRGAILALCRPGKGSLAIELDKGLSISARAPDGPAALRLADALMVESDPELRRVLARVLGTVATDDAGTSERLVEALTAGESDLETEKLLLDGIRRSGRSEHADALASWIGTVTDQPDRLDAGLSALIALDRDRGLRAIMDALSSTSDSGARASLIGRLGGARSDEIFDVLADFLRSDPDVAVRRAALPRVAEYGKEKAESILRDTAQNDGDEDIRHAAELLLKQYESGPDGGAGGGG